MERFEDKLQRNASLMRNEENARLHVPERRKTGNPAFIWRCVATSAAVIAAFVLGWILPHPSAPASAPTIVQVRDTLFIPQLVHDTIVQMRVEQREKIVYRDRETPLLAKADTSSLSMPDDTVPSSEVRCTSILCDGIDYSMLGIW